MNSKKLITLISCFTLNIYAVEVPSWYENYETILNKIDSLEEELKQQIAFNQKWDEKLKPWCAELRQRGADRDAVFACVKSEFNKLDREGKNLESTIAKRNNTIIDLKKKIEQLENTIAELNQSIALLEKEILELKSAYVTLFELDEEKAESMISEIDQLREAYEVMIKEREKLRKTLEMFYQCIKAHDHDENVDMHKFAEEIGCPMG